MILHSVAPKELVQADYQVLRSYEKLDTARPIEDLLFIQSLEGRSHNGSGVFNKRTYVNTTIDDVVRALDRDPDEIKAARQRLIDAISDYTTAVMNGEKHDRLVSADGEPFLGLPLFHERRVNGRDVLRGLYLGGLRDNPDIRKEAEKRYQIRIGGGRCYVVDIRVMLEMNLDGERLAHEAHEERLEEYRKRGLIVASDGQVDPRTQRYFYIRHRIGPGQSDDAAFIMAGILYNADVAFGVFLADALDTLEKYAPLYRDQDGDLAFQIARGFKDLNLTLDDAYELIYLSSIPEVEEDLIPDSSLRYLLSIDARSQKTAFQNHLDFLEGRAVAPLPVSFKKIPSTQFYEYINRRLLNVSKFEKLAVPNLTVQQLDRPAIEISKKDFCVMPKDSTVSDVVRKFKETKAEILVIQDKNQKVIGTLTPHDLLHYLNGSQNHA